MSNLSRLVDLGQLQDRTILNRRFQLSLACSEWGCRVLNRFTFLPWKRDAHLKKIVSSCCVSGKQCKQGPRHLRRKGAAWDTPKKKLMAHISPICSHLTGSVGPEANRQKQLGPFWYRTRRWWSSESKTSQLHAFQVGTIQNIQSPTHHFQSNCATCHVHDWLVSFLTSSQPLIRFYSTTYNLKYWEVERSKNTTWSCIVQSNRSKRICTSYFSKNNI
jgi:hypothetical protein